jgi:hypothetical protein
MRNPVMSSVIDENRDEYSDEQRKYTDGYSNEYRDEQRKYRVEHNEGTVMSSVSRLMSTANEYSDEQRKYSDEYSDEKRKYSDFDDNDEYSC